MAPNKRTLFGFDELSGKSRIITGYCVDTDQDGDKVVWKLVGSKVPDGGSGEVIMAGGKYTGMSGKSTSDCTHGGSLSSYVGHCDVERTFKFP
jgi:hypothetical protein